MKVRCRVRPALKEAVSTTRSSRVVEGDQQLPRQEQNYANRKVSMYCQVGPVECVVHAGHDYCAAPTQLQPGEH